MLSHAPPGSPSPWRPLALLVSWRPAGSAPQFPIPDAATPHLPAAAPLPCGPAALTDDWASIPSAPAPAVPLRCHGRQPARACRPLQRPRRGNKVFASPAL